MIKSIEIQNYKSIEKLSFELGQFNILIGENGSGKSNILEAIALHAAASDDKLNDEFLANRGIRLAKKELMRAGFNKNEEDIKIDIKNLENTSNIISINFSDDSQNWEYDYLKDIKEYIKAKPYTNFEDIVNKMTRQSYKIFLKIFYDNIDITTFLIYAPDYLTLKNSFERQGHIKPFGVNGEGLVPHLLELVEQGKTEILEEIKENLQLISWFEGLDIDRERHFNTPVFKIKDKFLEDGIQYFNLESANEGFLYLLFYFTLFISPKSPNFFAIENIDNALNPKLCRELIKILVNLAKKHQKQVIVTAHNPAILDGLNLHDSAQRLLVTARNLDGFTRIKRIEAKPTTEGATAMRLSEMFMNGFIGGLPKNF